MCIDCFGNIPFETCFKLKSNSKTFYIKTRITSDPEPGDLETFKQMTIDLYLEFSFGRVTAKYDFEIEQEY